MNFSGDKGYAANKGYLVGGGGGEGRGDRLRQNFVACAYWNAGLVTDAQGRVSAHFQAPDGLTEYQVMAVVNEGRGAVRQRRGRVPHQQAGDARTGDAEVRQRGRPPDPAGVVVHNQSRRRGRGGGDD